MELIKERLKVTRALKAEAVLEKKTGDTKPGKSTVASSQKLSIHDVGVIIPALNEEKNIGDVLSNLKNQGYSDIVVIDGMSKDETSRIAARHGAKVVSQNDKGKGGAIRQGFSNGYLNADAIVIMDADGSMDPKEISSLIEALNSGADVVKGSRFLKKGGSYDMSLLRRIGNTLMVMVVNLLWGVKVTDLCYGFVAFNRRAVEKMAPVLKAQNFEIETEIFLKSLSLGLVVKEVPSMEFKRKSGRSNLNSFKDGVRIFKTIAEEFVNPSSIRYR